MPVHMLPSNVLDAIQRFSMKQPEVAEKDRREAPGVELYVDDWLWVKPIPLKAGEACVQHTHAHDHVSLIASGTVRAWVDGQDKGEISAPSCFKVAALAEHRFLAVTDAVIVCIHHLHGKGYPEIVGED